MVMTVIETIAKTGAARGRFRAVDESEPSDLRIEDREGLAFGPMPRPTAPSSTCRKI